MIDKERIKYLNNKAININGDYVVYWMQASQRSEYNHALEYSIRRANELEKPLIVYFVITNDFPEANYRHYSFMIEGLKEVKSSLNLRNVKMIIELKNPDEGIIELSKDAVLLVTDRGYLKKEIEWRNNVSKKININFVQIETNVIVPIEEVSNKEEYSAATIRNKINKQLSKYIKDFVYESIENSIEIDDYFNFDNMEKYLKDNSVSKSKYFIGGTSQAKKHLSVFVESKINKYDELHNDPSLDYQSNMSPYLHFGQISPLYIYKEVNNEKYIEELVVRRELAINFIYFNKNYDNYNCIPNWAKKSLENHMDDKREYIYDLKTLEKGLTHDDYWNTAQKEMLITGKMHGY
ncbi:MAG: deoxyribodipyrimidine photolyase, partial [Tenericutes bacterium]|nr:deoxyribodipyrimidine photolyase [Mycoplasmatota bacterium]